VARSAALGQGVLEPGDRGSLGQPVVSELGGATAYGSSLGFLSSLMDVGHSIGPLATGLLVYSVSIQFGYAVAAGLLIVAALMFSAVLWRARRAPIAPRAIDLG